MVPTQVAGRSLVHAAAEPRKDPPSFAAGPPGAPQQAAGGCSEKQPAALLTVARPQRPQATPKAYPEAFFEC